VQSLQPEAELPTYETQPTQYDPEPIQYKEEPTEYETEYTLETSPTPSRVAVLTLPMGWGGHGCSSYIAGWLQDKHGSDMIFHDTRWVGSRAAMAQTAEDIIQDMNIGVVVVSPAERGTNYFISKIREQRDDIFIIYIGYDSYGYHDPPYISQTFSEAAHMADLILNIDMMEMYRRLPAQAQKLGAETLVFLYIEPDDDSQWVVDTSYEKNLMRAASGEIGLQFIELSRSPWAIGCGSSYNSYLWDYVFPLIAEYGNNTTFIGLGGHRMFAMLAHSGAIYLPSYAQSSPSNIMNGMLLYGVHGGLNFDERPINNLELVIQEIRKTLAGKDMLGRVSSWPISASTLLTYAAVEYGFKWMNGEVLYDGIDSEILQQIMENIISTYTGEEGLGATLTQRTYNGNSYPHYLLVFIDFMTY